MPSSNSHKAELRIKRELSETVAFAAESLNVIS